MAVVVQHFETNQTARTQFGTKVIRALQRSPGLTACIYKKVKPARVGGRQTISAKVDLDRFYRVMDCTCRALVFHDEQRKLFGGLTIRATAFRFPDGKPDDDEAALAFNIRRLLRSQAKRGANPDAFWYKVFDDPAKITAVRLVFYGGFSVYAVSDQPASSGAA